MFSHGWKALERDVRERISCCPYRGVVVLHASTPAGLVYDVEPTFRERRAIAAALSPGFLRNAKWAASLIGGGPHRCPHGPRGPVPPGVMP